MFIKCLTYVWKILLFLYPSKSKCRDVYCRLSSVAVYLIGHLAAALLEKKQQTLDISRGRPLAKGGGAYIRGKVHNII